MVPRGETLHTTSQLDHRGVLQCEVLGDVEIHGMKEVRVRNTAVHIPT